MKQIILLLIACSFLTSVFGQVPGYQGKRLIASADLNLFLRMEHHGYNDYDNKYFGDYSTKKGLRLEYILTRSWNIGLGFDQMNLGVITAREYRSNNFNTSFPELRNDRGYIAVRDKSIGIHAKKFPFRRMGQLAPLGTFVTIAAHRRFGKVVYLDEVNGEIQKDYITLSNYSSWSVMAGFGRQYIFYNRITFKVAFEMGVIPTALPQYPGVYTEPIEEEHLSKLALKRLSPAMFYHLSIGIGVLVF